MFSNSNLTPATTSLGSKTQKILLDTVTGIYHCAFCEFSGSSVQAVGRHRRTAHAEDTAAGRRAAKRAAKLAANPTPEPTTLEALGYLAAKISVDAEAIAMLTHAANIEADQSGKVDREWKARALAAEKSLKSLRKILGGQS